MRVSSSNRSVIQQSFFDDLERWLKDNQFSEREFKKGMDRLAGLLALTCLSFAQEKSRGPLDPQDKRREKAWLIPVRRISQEYYYSWYEERISQGHWETGNRSREAFYIEYGINHQGTGREDSGGNRNRVRRPIMKLSMLATLKWIEHTKVVNRVASTVFIGDNSRGGHTNLAGQGMQSGRVGTVIGGKGAFGSTKQTLSSMRNA